MRPDLVVGLLVTTGRRRRRLTPGRCARPALQPADLLQADRPLQVGEHPAGGEQGRLVAVGRAEQEGALAQPGDHPPQLLLVEPLGAAGDTGDDPVLVLAGLQPAHEPGADVGQPLVVQVHRVLGGQDHAETEGAGLLEQEQHGFLGRRVGAGREEAEDLVHVEQAAQAAAALLAAHPAEQPAEQQGDEEHALAVTQVGDGEDGDARLARRRVEQLLDGQRLALHPAAESRTGDEGIELQGQFHPFGRRVEGVHREHAHLLERRLRHPGDEGFQGKRLALLPGIVEDGGEEHVLAALQRVGVDAEQAEQRGHGGADHVGQGLGVGQHLGGRRLEAVENGHRPHGGAARGVHGELGALPHAPDALAVLVPVGQPLAPLVGGAPGQFVHAQPLLLGRGRVDPGAEIGRGQVREGEQQVAHVALGVDDDGRQPVNGRLLEQRDAQAGLAAAGHADDGRVRGQLLALDEQRPAGCLAGVRVDFPAQVEEIELFVIDRVRHGAPPAALFD